MPTRKLRERIEGIETYFLSASASGARASAVAARENAEAPVAQASENDSTLNFILKDLVRMEAHAGSSRLAYFIHQQLIGATGATDRGVHQAPFYVLTGVGAPAVLIEVGYISHPEEGKRLGRSRVPGEARHGDHRGREGVPERAAQARQRPGGSRAREDRRGGAGSRRLSQSLREGRGEVCATPVTG